MLICLCSGVSEQEIIEALEKHNFDNMRQLCERLHICQQCFSCKPDIEHLWEQHKDIILIQKKEI